MEFEEAARQAANLVHSLPIRTRVRVISHGDADGLAAAAIAAIALYREGYGFHISIKRTGPGLTSDMESEDNDLVIWCDIGSSNLEELEALEGATILCDHHIMQGDLIDGINLNVRSYGIDGSQEACGASATLALALALDERNLDLTELAVAGAIGDKQDRDGFFGYNKKVLEAASQEGYISLQEQPAFSSEVNLMDALEESTEPFFTDFAGDGTMRFLKKLDIDPLKPFTDLSEAQQQKLLSALAVKLVEQNACDITLMQIVPVGKTLGSLVDLSSKLNACARGEQESVGIAFCLGSTTAKDMACDLQREYRSAVRQEMRDLEEVTPDELSHLTYFFIKNSSLKGVSAGLSMEYLPNFSVHKPVISLSEGIDTVSISGRGTPRLVEQGLNLAAGMQQAAETVGGSGGGHPIAAGADVPKGKEKIFLDALNTVLSQQ